MELYRDDGLTIVQRTSQPQAERVKKDFWKMFQDEGLEIEVECNKKVLIYQDVTLNVNDGTYKPYRKANDDIKHVHA